jgi:hypothetical protein
MSVTLQYRQGVPRAFFESGGTRQRVHIRIAGAGVCELNLVGAAGALWKPTTPSSFPANGWLTYPSHWLSAK